MDANDVAAGISDPSGEGIADIYSALRLNDSCIGRGFYSNSVCGGNGNPCISCTGKKIKKILLLNFATHLTLNTYRLIQESETLTT